MLRITVQNGPEVLTLKLEGRLADQSLQEFESTWQELARSLGKRDLCLDIRGVTFVSSQGHQLLARIQKESHNDYLTNSPLTTFVAQQAKRNAIRSQERM